jgi:hypothetical protein
MIFADMAPMAMMPGGSVVPAHNTDIQMQSEVITVYLYPDYYIVNVDYIFVNKGDTQKVTMGFPSCSNSDILATKEFKAFEDSSQLYTYISEGSWEYEVKSKHFFVDNLFGSIDQFECCNVDFKAGETKSIINTYKGIYGSCSIEGDDPYSYEYFQYILQTGKMWKDSIESIRLIINTDSVNSKLMLNKAYFQDKKCSFNNFDTIFQNIEPNFDFGFIVKKSKNLISYCASSRLYSQGVYKYDVNNIDDGLLSTAWVEGKSNYGIGEQIGFISNIVIKWGLLSMQIDSIGIINGYTYDDSTFFQNSRVKTIRISSGIGQGFANNEEIKDLRSKIETKNSDVIITLDDTKEMQYFVFDKPIQASMLVFTILDIYEGTKYKDTAISEVKFFVDQKVLVLKHYPN